VMTFSDVNDKLSRLDFSYNDENDLDEDFEEAEESKENGSE